MSIINKSHLYQFGERERYFSDLSEGLGGISQEARYGQITIFLSHKHNERKELYSAISFLKQFRVDVYIDWLDGGMPRITSGETAKRIKEKIKASDKFIFLGTEGAISSKWCNWELGFGDAHKFHEHIAILPIKDDGCDFSGSEYLQIYPHIEYVGCNSVKNIRTGYYFEEGYYVIYSPVGKKIKYYTKIEDWINR